MTDLDKAMNRHMAEIVFLEHRSFSYCDFCSEEVKGQPYAMAHGTFRNKIRERKQLGMVEVECNSGVAFYTLSGMHFGKRRKSKMMTPNHMVGLGSIQPVIKYYVSSRLIPRIKPIQQQSRKQISKPKHSQSRNEDYEFSTSQANNHCLFNDTSSRNVDNVKTESDGGNQTPLYHQINDLPLGQKSIHDIHLRFDIRDAWTILSKSISTSPHLRMNDNSHDIVLPTLNTEGLQIRITVHKTDTISVVVGCSKTPVASDIPGVFRLSKALTRVEERISRLIDESGRTIEGGYESLPVPECDRWYVTMWHFGRDSIKEYAGQAFCMTWDYAQNILIRAYTKDDLVVLDDGSKRSGIRLERQEYPGKSLADAIIEKLKQ
jgi:hypothetical protein